LLSFLFFTMQVKTWPYKSKVSKFRTPSCAEKP
jgi:hypothetical protein